MEKGSESSVLSTEESLIRHLYFTQIVNVWMYTKHFAPCIIMQLIECIMNVYVWVTVHVQKKERHRLYLN